MIPKVLHRLHLGNGAVEHMVPEWDEMFLDLNPGWQIRWWRPPDITWPLVNQELYDLCTNTGHRADILRYEVLHRFGGVYADWDMDFRAPMPASTHDGTHSAWCGNCRPIAWHEGMVDVEIAILGSAPNHPFLAHILKELTPWALINHSYSPVTRTGPIFWGAMLDRWKGQPVHRYPWRMWYPISTNERELAWKAHPGAVGVHHWMGSWIGGRSGNNGSHTILAHDAIAAMRRLMEPRLMDASSSTSTPSPSSGNGAEAILRASASPPSGFPPAPRPPPI